MTTCLGKELCFRFIACAFRKLLSIYVFSYFPFGFEGRICDLIVSVSDHCLSFYFIFVGLLILHFQSMPRSRGGGGLFQIYMAGVCGWKVEDPHPAIHIQCKPKNHTYSYNLE